MRNNCSRKCDNSNNNNSSKAAATVNAAVVAFAAVSANHKKEAARKRAQLIKSRYRRSNSNFTYHKIRQCGEELSDLPDGGRLVQQPVSVSVQHDLLQVLQVRVVDEGAEVGAVGRRH